MPTICRWGNSLAVRVPKSVSEACGLLVGTRVIVRSLDNGGLLILPANGGIAVTETQSLVKTVKPMTPAPKW